MTDLENFNMEVEWTHFKKMVNTRKGDHQIPEELVWLFKDLGLIRATRKGKNIEVGLTEKGEETN